MISIIIYSTYNDRFLKDCLESLKYIKLQDDFFVDLYIYDKNEKKPDIPVELNNLEITFLHTRENFSAVTNLGIKKAIKMDSKYIFLQNSDTVIHPECIQNLVSAKDSNEDVLIVGGYQTKYGDGFNTPNEWTTNTLENVERAEIKSLTGLKGFYKTDYVQGACMLFETGLAEKIGLFDERFHLFYEETEFCRRALRYGDIGVLEDAKIQHYGGGTWKGSKFLRIKRDIFYLSNQVIFEATSTPCSYWGVFKKMLSVIKKQIRHILTKEDSIYINILHYPLVIIFILYRVGLIMDLKRFYDK